MNKHTLSRKFLDVIPTTFRSFMKQKLSSQKSLEMSRKPIIIIIIIIFMLVDLIQLSQISGQRVTIGQYPGKVNCLCNKILYIHKKKRILFDKK
jgi:hypothetical protein